MTKDKSLSLETMRAERQTSESVYIQFANSGKYHNSHAFCFYEGEDRKYYDNRIREKFQDNFITYPVGNKKEVLKLLKVIRDSGLYENVCTMFFVDRDFDESIMGTDIDLFETPCYSIENLYSQPECLMKILQSEFGLNVMDADYQKCMKDFQLRQKEFDNHMLEFNALVYLRRKKSNSNSNYSFSSVKTSHMVKVKVDKITKATKYDETLAEIREKLNFDNSEIEEAKIELLKTRVFSLDFRGKNELDFFVNFIKELKLLNDAGGYFSVKRNNIHIDITSNRLSELSQYAITPENLEDFLGEHRDRFFELTKAS